MVRDHSSVFLYDGFLAVGPARPRSTGFCYLASPGAKSLLFQAHVTGPAEHNPGGGMEQNFAEKDRAHLQKFLEENGYL
ncbi:hypothetical protein ANCDUO_07259 [Ancylostoma duodenale]|uniref:Uncharacterized protein n=1 Tax=Ancylostoma duodenale TaxID=51022 RepID=A0A0C2GMI8_9BILA|nr:hypothetical protein ANCDUO_07259 [Ancylostoma duodenale]